MNDMQIVAQRLEFGTCLTAGLVCFGHIMDLVEELHPPFLATAKSLAWTFGLNNTSLP